MRQSKLQKRQQFNAEVTLGVLAIIIAVTASIIIFGAFNKAGSGGNMIFAGLYATIGLLAYAVPFILLYASYLLWRGKLPNINLYRFLGLTLILLSLMGLMSVFDERFSGYLGQIALSPILTTIGLVPTVLAFFAFCYAGLMILLDRKHLFDFPGLSLPSLSSFSMPKISLSKKDKHDDEEEEDYEEEEDHKNIRDEILEKNVNQNKNSEEDEEEEDYEEEEEIEEKPKKVFKLNPEFVPPPTNLLSNDSGKPAAGDTIAKMKAIKSTLDTFNIPVEMGSVTVGPSVTQFTLKPAQGVNVKRVLGLKDNLQMALSATNMYIQAPIPGKPFVGIEIPNEKKQQLGLGSMIDHPKFKDGGNMTVAIGKDIIGNPVYGNIETMPHLLIAGATRSGKSVTVQNLLISLLYKNSPYDLKLMVIDPKRVEFTAYKNLPHLGTPVITDAKNAIKCLNWAIGEMERRYDYFATEYPGIQNVSDYNKKILAPLYEKAKKGKEVKDMPERLPYIVIVFDEFNDFMLSYPKEITIAITSLTQKGRAAGIHLVLATQRPDVKVITGTIKANITARIALKTSSQIDSRTILDQAGAEDLLGNGDMLYMSPEYHRPTRIQAPFVSSEEIRAVIDYIKNDYNDFEDEKIDISKASMSIGGTTASSDFEESNNYDDESEPTSDAEYMKAKEYIIATGKASTTLLQSRFGWGYPKAAKFIMQLERFGVVGPSINNKQREVLIKKDGESHNKSNDDKNKTNQNKEDENLDDLF